MNDALDRPIRRRLDRSSTVDRDCLGRRVDSPVTVSVPERRSVRGWFRLQRRLYPPDPVINRRIPTVSAAVASTVPTIQRMSLVSRLAISVRTPAI